MDMMLYKVNIIIIIRVSRSVRQCGEIFFVKMLISEQLIFMQILRSKQNVWLTVNKHIVQPRAS